MQKNAHFSHFRSYNFLKNDSIDLKFSPKVENHPMLQFRKFQVHSSYEFLVITKNFFHFCKIHWPMKGQEMTSSYRITVKISGNVKQVTI